MAKEPEARGVVSSSASESRTVGDGGVGVQESTLPATDDPDDGEDGSDTGSSTSYWSSSSEDEDEEDEDNAEGVNGRQNEASGDEDDSAEAEEARAAERLRVLEAAGLLVRDDSKPQPGQPLSTSPTIGARLSPESVPRKRAARRTKGPRPEVPARRQRPSRKSSRPIPKPRREAPSVPEIVPPPVPEPEEQMEDAYDRFVKLQNEVTSSPCGGLALPRDDTGTGRSTSAGSESSDRPDSTVDASTAKTAGVDAPPQESGRRASGFFSSFLRSKGGPATGTGHQAGGRSTPIISGPISKANVQRVESGAHKPDDGSQGSAITPSNATWASFIDGETLQSMPDKERKRQEAIFELCHTESTHVRDLQTIVEVFYNAIMEAQQQGNTLLDEKARLVVFANVEDVMITAVSFLSDLEERQRSSRLYIDEIGDVLAEHLPRMKVYMPYCTNQSTAAQILSGARSRNAALEELLKRLRNSPQGRGLDLSSYLLTPMQRITRYPLLLGQVLKYTDEDHPDWSRLRKAVRTSEGILADTNERIRENESRERLKMLSQTLYIGEGARLDLTTETRCQGPRRIIKEEVLLKRKSKSGRKLTLILCNDLLLILAGPSNLYRMPAQLEEVIVREVKKSSARRMAASANVGGGSGPGSSGAAAAGDEACFQIVVAGQDKIDFKCSSVRGAHLWMRAIEEARSEALDAAGKAQSMHAAQRRASSKSMEQSLLS